MTKKMLLQIADSLEKARDKMNDSGAHWLKGALRSRNDDGEMKYCSIGAINAVVPQKGEFSLNNEMRKALANRGIYRKNSMGGPGATECIIEFNDARDREWPQVKGAFTRAINSLRREAESA